MSIPIIACLDPGDGQPGICLPGSHGHNLTSLLAFLQGLAISDLVPQQAWVDADSVIMSDLVFKVRFSDRQDPSLF